MSQSVDTLLKKAARVLESIAQRPMHEAQLLLAFYLDKEILWLMTHPDFQVDSYTGYFDLIKRRARHEPMEYLTSSVSFYSEHFYIAPGALIPRPETELLIDYLLDEVDKDFSGHIVEIGVGSGIISIILAMHLKFARFSAVDISADALEIARLNIAKFGLESQITLFEGNLLDPIDETVDILVSNPPYIQKGIQLEKNLSFEPQNALFGGDAGDEILKAIIDLSETRSIPLVACEMGFDQKEPIGAYVAETSHYQAHFYQDLAGFDRGFILRLKKDAYA